MSKPKWVVHDPVETPERFVGVDMGKPGTHLHYTVQHVASGAAHRPISASMMMMRAAGLPKIAFPSTIHDELGSPLLNQYAADAMQYALTNAFRTPKEFLPGNVTVNVELDRVKYFHDNLARVLDQQLWRKHQEEFLDRFLAGKAPTDPPWKFKIPKLSVMTTMQWEMQPTLWCTMILGEYEYVKYMAGRARKGTTEGDGYALFYHPPYYNQKLEKLGARSIELAAYQYHTEIVDYVRLELKEAREALVRCLLRRARALKALKTHHDILEQALFE